MKKIFLILALIATIGTKASARENYTNCGSYYEALRHIESTLNATMASFKPIPAEKINYLEKLRDDLTKLNRTYGENIERYESLKYEYESDIDTPQFKIFYKLKIAAYNISELNKKTWIIDKKNLDKMAQGKYTHMDLGDGKNPYDLIIKLNETYEFLLWIQSDFSNSKEEWITTIKVIPQGAADRFTKSRHEIMLATFSLASCHIRYLNEQVYLN